MRHQIFPIEQKYTCTKFGIKNGHVFAYMPHFNEEHFVIYYAWCINEDNI